MDRQAIEKSASRKGFWEILNAFFIVIGHVIWIGHVQFSKGFLRDFKWIFHPDWTCYLNWRCPFSERFFRDFKWISHPHRSCNLNTWAMEMSTFQKDFWEILNGFFILIGHVIWIHERWDVHFSKGFLSDFKWIFHPDRTCYLNWRCPPFRQIFERF